MNIEAEKEKIQSIKERVSQLEKIGFSKTKEEKEELKNLKAEVRKKIYEVKKYKKDIEDEEQRRNAEIEKKEKEKREAERKRIKQQQAEARRIKREERLRLKQEAKREKSLKYIKEQVELDITMNKIYEQIHICELDIMSRLLESFNFKNKKEFILFSLAAFPTLEFYEGKISKINIADKSDELKILYVNSLKRLYAYIKCVDPNEFKDMYDVDLSFVLDKLDSLYIDI